jgi:cell division control protein 6
MPHPEDDRTSDIDQPTATEESGDSEIRTDSAIADEDESMPHDDQSTTEPNRRTDNTSATPNDDSGGLTIRDRVENSLTEGSSVSVFVNKHLVQPDTIVNADRIVGRDNQLDSIIDLLLPAVKGGRPPNMLLYGPSGTGKSLIINAVAEEITDLCDSRGIEFGVIRLNCQRIASLDKAVYAMVKAVAEDVGVNVGIPKNGVATSSKYDYLYDLVSEHYETMLFILDELDYLKGRRNREEPDYSRLLYQLSRASAEGDIDGRVSVAAITNDIQLMQKVDGRAESSFNPDNVDFPDYDANQLRKILYHRQDAFREDTLTDDAIPLAAAFAAQNDGDARKAIDLLRKAGEIADKHTEEQVTETYVRMAQNQLDVDRAQKVIMGLSTQKKLSLFSTVAVYELTKKSIESVPSPVGYQVYKWLTDTLNTDQKSQDSYRRYVKEIESYNLLTKERSSRGRGRGVHSEYQFGTEPEVIYKTVLADGRLSDVDEELLKAVVNAQLADFLNP